MHATFAFLTDIPTANLVNKIAWQLYCQHQIGIEVRRLPPHVSLKQPFAIDDLDALDAYFTEFARTLQPFRMDINGLTLSEQPPEQPEYSALYLTVKPTERLRATHNRLNEELAARFGNREAAFDGDAYQFHLTVAAGLGQVVAYREAFGTTAWGPLTFETQHLALFVYDNDGDNWQYLPYKIIPLGSPL